MKNRLDRYKIFLIIISFMMLSLISIIVMLHLNLLFSDYNNIQFHAKRIMEFKELLLHNNLNSTVSFNYFHGAAIMGMYPYLSLLPFVLVSFFVSSYVKIYDYSIAIIIFMSLLIGYFSCFRYKKSIKISYIFSIVYNISSVIFFNAFSNGDLGITMSLVFLPMSIFGFIRIINGSSDSYELILGLFLLSLCQIPTTIIIFCFLILWVLINFRELNKSIKIKLFNSLVIIVMITSITWIPLLKIILFNPLNTPGSTVVPLQNSNITSIIQNLGVVPFIFIFILLVSFRQFSKLDKQAYIFSLIVIILSSKLVPMKFLTNFSIIRLINKFQFTSRFLIIPQILLSYLSALIINRTINHLKSYKMKEITLTLIIVFSVFIQLFSQIMIVNSECFQSHKIMDDMYPINNNYFITKISTKYLYNGYTNNIDYYPKVSNNKAKYINCNKGYYNHQDVIKLYNKGYNTFVFNTNRNIDKLYLPLFKYNKESILLKSKHHILHYDVSKYNTLIINNIKRGSHKFTIRYNPNIWLVYLKYFLFLLGFIYLFIINIDFNKSNLLLKIKNLL